MPILKIKLPQKITSIIKIVFISLFLYFLISVLPASTMIILADESALTAPHVNNEILVKLKSSAKIYQLKVPAGELTDFIKANDGNNSLAYAEPNYLYDSTLEPNDIYYTQQIYLSGIKAQQAWNYSIGNNSVIIAILDTGVAIDHPDLKNNLWYNLKEIPSNGIDDDGNGYIDDYHGWDFVTGTADPRPKFQGSYNFLGMNHGTIVTGVAAAHGNNSEGIAGLAWRAKIMPLRVLNGEGSGNTMDVAMAIDYARENGAEIINLSFVGSGKSQTLEDAIKRAYEAGILVVAAAGNEVENGVDMTKSPKYPVCHDGGFNNNWVIGVASLDNNDKLASFSNYGACVDILTPGVGIFGALYKDNNNPLYSREYGGYWTGTSVSSPQVVGVAALVKSLKPKLSLLELRDLLLNNADNIDNTNGLYLGKLGHGKLNAEKVVQATINSVSQAEYKIDRLVVSPMSKGGAHVKIYENNQLTGQFFSFAKNKNYGSNIATFDFDKNGLEEIVAAASKGEEPFVKIFDLKGNLKSEFLAYDKKMKQGLRVAVGDINNDKLDEIITVPGAGNEPLVRIYSQTGKLEKEFYAFNKFFTGGLSLAVGDVNNDSFDEIIVGSGAGTSPMVKIFNYDGTAVSQFMAYAPTFMKGITLAAGDVNGDGDAEIITGTLAGGGPQVRIFNWQGSNKGQFFAYGQKFLGGVNVASGDVNGDGVSEIITGAGPGGGPHVRIFNSSGEIIDQFFAYDAKFKGGVNVAAGK